MIDSARSVDYLTAKRWPNGVHCPRCGSGNYSVLRCRFQWTCLACRYRFSVKSGTRIHKTKRPLSLWIECASFFQRNPDAPNLSFYKRRMGMKRGNEMCRLVKKAVKKSKKDPLRWILFNTRGVVQDLASVRVGPRTMVRLDRHYNDSDSPLSACIAVPSEELSIARDAIYRVLQSCSEETKQVISKHFYDGDKQEDFIADALNEFRNNMPNELRFLLG